MSAPDVRTSTSDGRAIPRFMLCPMIPLDKEFLRDMQRIAVNDAQALPVWAENFVSRPDEEAVYFQEKEWRDLGSGKPAPHRVDLYTIHRGLHKVFEPRFDLSIAMRQVIVRALFEQQARPSVLTLQPRAVSAVIQLALFEQVIW